MAEENNVLAVTQSVSIEPKPTSRWLAMLAAHKKVSALTLAGNESGFFRVMHLNCPSYCFVMVCRVRSMMSLS